MARVARSGEDCWLAISGKMIYKPSTLPVACCRPTLPPPTPGLQPKPCATFGDRITQSSVVIAGSPSPRANKSGSGTRLYTLEIGLIPQRRSHSVSQSVSQGDSQTVNPSYFSHSPTTSSCLIGVRLAVEAPDVHERLHRPEHHERPTDVVWNGETTSWGKYIQLSATHYSHRHKKNPLTSGHHHALGKRDFIITWWESILPQTVNSVFHQLSGKQI